MDNTVNTSFQKFSAELLVEWICQHLETYPGKFYVNNHPVDEDLKKQGQKDIRIEGVPQCDWVLVDAGDIIVHVFRPEVRSFYNLEKLWSTTMPV